jgi:hypothetical protein
MNFLYLIVKTNLNENEFDDPQKSIEYNKK